FSAVQRLTSETIKRIGGVRLTIGLWWIARDSAELALERRQSLHACERVLAERDRRCDRRQFHRAEWRHHWLHRRQRRHLRHLSHLGRRRHLWHRRQFRQRWEVGHRWHGRHLEVEVNVRHRFPSAIHCQRGGREVEVEVHVWHLDRWNRRDRRDRRNEIEVHVLQRVETILEVEEIRSPHFGQQWRSLRFGGGSRLHRFDFRRRRCGNWCRLRRRILRSTGESAGSQCDGDESCSDHPSPSLILRIELWQPRS